MHVYAGRLFTFTGTSLEGLLEQNGSGKYPSLDTVKNVKNEMILVHHRKWESC